MLSKCLREISTHPDDSKAIGALLANMEQRSNASHSYVFLKDSHDAYSHAHEWCAPRIMSKKQSTAYASYECPMARNVEKGWTYRDTGYSDDGKNIYKALSRQGIKAVVEFPIGKDNEIHGLVEVGDCMDTHSWTGEGGTDAAHFYRPYHLCLIIDRRNIMYM